MAENALKAISKTDEELRVGNYIALFGGKDLEGEHFTPETDFESSYTKTGVLYVDWEHGFGKTVDGKTSPGPDDILGYVDWKTTKVDDMGVWVERVLNRRNQYIQYIETLIEEGLIANSTEAVEAGVEKTKSGEIQKWPLRRDTLTVMPMEPRMMSENVISAVKGLAKANPKLEALLPQEVGETSSADAKPGESDSGEIKKFQRIQLRAHAKLALD